jgi:hypothetical protein
LESDLNTMVRKDLLMALGDFHLIHKFLIPMEEFSRNNILCIDNIERERTVKDIKSHNESGESIVFVDKSV